MKPRRSTMLVARACSRLKQSGETADVSRGMRIRETTPRARLAIAACVAVATALCTSGCGSSAVITGPLARAADVTAHAGGAQMAMKMEAQTGGSSTFTLNAHGHFDFSTLEAEMSLDMSGLPESSSTPSGSLQMTEIMKLPDIYINASVFAGKLPGGAQWMKVDLGRFLGGLGLNLQAEGAQANPAEYLNYLRATGGAVSAVGHETVRGVPTTHYQGSIDLEKAAEELPSTNRSQLRATFSQLRTITGVGTIPIDVWVDSHDLVRKIAMEYPLTVSGSSGHFTMSIEYFDFGAPSPVGVPPASEVFVASSSALGQLSTGGNSASAE